MAFPLADPPSNAETCLDERLDFFTRPETKYVIERTFDCTIAPKSLLRPEDRRLEFEIPISSFFTDLSRLNIEWVLSIVDADGNALNNVRQAVAEIPAADGNPRVPAVTAYTACGFEQQIAQSIMKQVDFRINGTSLAPLHNNYFISAYIGTLLNYSQTSRTSYLEGKVGWFDEKNLEETTGIGFDGHARRVKLTDGGKKLYCSSAFFVGICQQSKLLLPLCTINIDIDLNDNATVLRSGETNPQFKYKVEKAEICCRRVKMLDSYQQQIETKLLKNPAIYTMDIINTKSNIIPRGVMSYKWSDPFSSSFLPSMCIVMLTKQT